MLTPAQKRFVDAEKARKVVMDQFAEALKEVADALGVGAYFQDEEDGTVYKITEPTGRWVTFDKVSYVRTKRNGESQGTLSVKETVAAGFTVK